jgi:hypothetical protein
MMQLKSVNLEKISETGLFIAAFVWDGVLGLRGCFKGSRRSEKSFYQTGVKPMCLVPWDVSPMPSALRSTR